MGKKSLLKITFACLVFVFLISGALVLKQSSKSNEAKAQIWPQTIGVENTRPTDVRGFFYDYYKWPSSKRLKDNDSLRQVIEMIAINNTNPEEEKFAVGSQMIDFNGDGLNDYLYFYYQPMIATAGERGYIALENTGENNFNLKYKCLWGHNQEPSPFGKDTVYGDCADMSDLSRYEQTEFFKKYFAPTGSYLLYNLYDLYEQGLYGQNEQAVGELSALDQLYFMPGRLEPSFFMDHRAWRASDKINFDDNRLKMLYSLSTVSISKILNPNDPYTDNLSDSAVQFVDINADNFVDALFHHEEKDFWFYTQHTNFSASAILINQGSLDFEVIYKCYEGDKAELPPTHSVVSFYGDCAQ